MTLQTDGFTLLEVMMTALVLGLIAMLSWPSIRNLSQSVSRKEIAQRFLNQVRFARERAVHLGRTQDVQAPVGTVSTSHRVSLFPDGTAGYFQARFEKGGEHSLVVCVNENGRVELREE